MKRYGQIIQVRPELEEKYRYLHANAWKGILDMITACNIRNYSIYLRDGFLFTYYEYVGTDYEGDMAKMALDPLTQQWWDECKPCQKPIETATANEWWVDMDEVFHLD